MSIDNKRGFTVEHNTNTKTNINITDISPSGLILDSVTSKKTELNNAPEITGEWHIHLYSSYDNMQKLIEGKATIEFINNEYIITTKFNQSTSKSTQVTLTKANDKWNLLYTFVAEMDYAKIDDNLGFAQLTYFGKGCNLYCDCYMMNRIEDHYIGSSLGGVYANYGKGTYGKIIFIRKGVKIDSILERWHNK